MQIDDLYFGVVGEADVGTSGTFFMDDCKWSDEPAPLWVASDAPRYYNWPCWYEMDVHQLAAAGGMGTSEMIGAVARQVGKPLAGVMGTGQMAGTITKQLQMALAAAMGTAQMAGTIAKAIAISAAGAMGTSQMAGTIKTQIGKVLTFLFDVQIDVDAALDVSLENEDE